MSEDIIQFNKKSFNTLFFGTWLCGAIVGASLKTPVTQFFQNKQNITTDQNHVDHKQSQYKVHKMPEV